MTKNEKGENEINLEKKKKRRGGDFIKEKYEKAWKEERKREENHRQSIPELVLLNKFMWCHTDLLLIQSHKGVIKNV